MQCPSCEYEFPKRPKSVSWLSRIFSGSSTEPFQLPDNVRTLSDLRHGERAQVLCLGRTTSSRPNALAVFGLVPGAEVTLLQQRPSCVVKVGETELALDFDIAREIMVQPV
jgi:Fe2+ transport system protein FeoA